MNVPVLLLWCAWIGGSFLLGSVMFCRLVPRLLTGQDVTVLSDDGNPGAANVFIHCGVPTGLLCLALDLAKGFIPVYWGMRVLDWQLLPFAVVLAAPTLGHALAPLNRFHGGKCIATAFGVLLGLIPTSYIVLVLAGLYIFFSVAVKISPNRYRSMLTFLLFGGVCAVHFLRAGQYSLALGGCLVAVIAFLRHTRYFSSVPENESKPALRRRSAE